jgi:hypothetical protein
MSTVIDGSNSVTINSGAILGITSGTAVASTSGTSIDFTSIPSWVKRVTINMNGVSTNGTAYPLIQLGSGSVTATGYLGSSSNIVNGVSPTTVNFAIGIGIVNGATAAAIMQGSIVCTLLGSNAWVIAGTLYRSDAATSITTGGSVTLSGALDRVRVTTNNGTDTFDAGSINILYE